MSAVVQLLGWALVHALWQGCLLGLLAALGGWFLAGRSRHRLNSVLLALCLILPAVTAWQVHRQAPLVARWVDGAEPFQEPSQVLASQVVPRPLLARLEAALQPQLPRLVALWALGASLMALRLGGGFVLSQQWRRGGVPAPDHWQETLDRLSRRMGLRRPVGLLLVERGQTPLAMGLWKPVVLLPVALLTSLPPAYLEALLAHELAHVRRLDYLGNLMQGIVETVLFFHPAVWWLSARIRREREELADALAAEGLGNPRLLAHALNALDDLQSPAQPTLFPALAARGGHLLTRIERLLSPRPLGRVPWGVLSLLLLPGAVFALRAAVPEQPAIPAPAALVAQVDALAAKEDLDPHLLRSMAWVESGFNPTAKSPLGATGLLQVMPVTASAHGAKDLSDPAQVMAAGAKYLRFLLDRYQGDVQKAVTAYNCGEKALEAGQVTEEATRYRTLVLDVLKARAVQPEAPLAEGEVQGCLRRIGEDLLIQLRINHQGELNLKLLAEERSLGAVHIGNKLSDETLQVHSWVESRPTIRIRAPRPGESLRIQVQDRAGWKGEMAVSVDAPWRTFAFCTVKTTP